MKHIVFHFFPKLSTAQRWIIFIMLVISGLLLQMLTRNFWSGSVLLFLASLLMSHKGIDLRAHPERFNHHTEWKNSTRSQIEELLTMYRKMKIWDRSGYEVSSCAGGLFFVLLLAAGFTIMIAGIEENDLMMIFSGGNLLMLMTPQYFSGFRKYDAGARVILYARECLQAATMIEEMQPGKIKVSFLTLLAKKANSDIFYPKEVKLKMTTDDAPESFMGAYGQLSVNKVGSNEYPYFYTVLIFKPEFELERKMHGIQLRNDVMIKEFSSENGVDVLVLRQRTTRTSGYHTNAKAVRGILATTFDVYEQLTKKHKK